MIRSGRPPLRMHWRQLTSIWFRMVPVVVVVVRPVDTLLRQ
jgi:hypothetical protein